MNQKLQRFPSSEMSTPFETPEWLVAQFAPPAPPPPVDDHRVEGLVNGFIAGKQDALFDAPDAYYRSQGRDAVDGAPAIARRLRDLRTATLDQARDDASGRRSARAATGFGRPERATAEAIMNQQAEAFANDPYAAGTALYPDVGPALPEEDAAGRLRQARMIEARRGVAAPDQNHNEPSKESRIPHRRLVTSWHPSTTSRAWRRPGKRERLNAVISPKETLGHYLSQVGAFDYQRCTYKFGKDGFTQLRQFRNISNINVGLFAQTLGLPLRVTLRIAGEYASKNSSNARPNQPFKLDPQTMDYIVTGYHLGDDGIIE